METATPAGPPADVLFDPDSPQWRRVSPKLIKVRLILIGIWSGVPIIGGVVAAIATPYRWIWLIVGLLALGGLWSASLNGRRVRAIGYLERADDLLIRRGLFIRDMVVVPYGRLQYVDVTAGPLDRAFGIAKLDLNTAAGSLDAQLPGLEPEEAARLRDRLSELGNSRMAGL
ncbi:MAG: PH domain-containing protein [Bifidobacteriaceae bacterium]|jgi:membrane protein YdbS with pleckstrin-like domain|nr:PH domain-containing protein [Bifidobacteriaceae bacterium]